MTGHAPQDFSLHYIRLFEEQGLTKNGIVTRRQLNSAPARSLHSVQIHPPPKTSRVSFQEIVRNVNRVSSVGLNECMRMDKIEL